MPDELQLNKNTHKNTQRDPASDTKFFFLKLLLLLLLIFFTVTSHSWFFFHFPFFHCLKHEQLRGARTLARPLTSGRCRRPGEGGEGWEGREGRGHPGRRQLLVTSRVRQQETREAPLFSFFSFLDAFRLSWNNRKWTCRHHIPRSGGRASTCSTR